MVNKTYVWITYVKKNNIKLIKYLQKNHNVSTYNYFPMGFYGLNVFFDI
jgi:hypothetical protein